MSASHDHNYIPVRLPPDRQIFGQFLIEVGKADSKTIQKAIKTQEEERSSTLRDSHRFLGKILLEDFRVFKNTVELNRYLKEYQKYKENVENYFFVASQFASGKDNKSEQGE